MHVFVLSLVTNQRDETRGDDAWRDNCCVYALNLVEPIAVKEVN